MEDDLEECDIYGLKGTYFWTTRYYHPDNSFTMRDLLDNHLPKYVEVNLEDGSYAEVTVDVTNYALHAGGNGTSYNHFVKWVKI
jgi:hypothetical protein